MSSDVFVLLLARTDETAMIREKMLASIDEGAKKPDGRKFSNANPDEKLGVCPRVFRVPARSSTRASDGKQKSQHTRNSW